MHIIFVGIQTAISRLNINLREVKYFIKKLLHLSKANIVLKTKISCNERWLSKIYSWQNWNSSVLQIIDRNISNWRRIYVTPLLWKTSSGTLRRCFSTSKCCELRIKMTQLTDMVTSYGNSTARPIWWCIHAFWFWNITIYNLHFSLGRRNIC